MRVRIKGTNIYVKCIDVGVSPTGYKGLECEYLNGPHKGSKTVIPGDCLVEEYEEEKKPQTTDNNERNNMTAAKARETAFKTVHTTYEEGLNNMINVIDETIENHAKKGELSISFDLKELIVNYIKLSNHTIYETMREYIKTQYEKKGFKVYNTRFGCSPTYTTIDW